MLQLEYRITTLLTLFTHHFLMLTENFILKTIIVKDNH